MKKILYITYDGLTDPLGQSQILPYLVGLSRHDFQFTILSFEKKESYKKEKDTVKNIIDAANIKWIPLSFTGKPPILSKIYDRWKLKNTSLKLFKKEKFDMIHCRSYVPAEIGLFLKKKNGAKFLFDMRGFWADEKKDSSWNISNPIFKIIYSYYKKKEKQYLHNADYIISLTKAGKKEMMKWSSYKPSIPIAVIPTCTDMDLFTLTSEKDKKNSRENLGISNEALVVSYLGSVGTWYMLDEMLILFRKLKEKYRDAVFLFVTPTKKYLIDQAISKFGLHPKDFIIVKARRSEVPFLVKASDINVSFIRPVYSKISSSPTKLGEVLSMGIPVICNGGVGDVEEIVKESNSGYVINNFTEEEFDNAILAIPGLLQKSSPDIRSHAENIFSLEKGIHTYFETYQTIFS